jgi:hypothetical protein
VTIITQFDTDPALVILKDKHHAWHTSGGAHGFPSRQFPSGTPNSGHEFLQFHADVISQFFAWNNVNNAVSGADLAAWTAVPIELKLPETGWPNPGFNGNLADAEARINSNMPPFATDDALGIHIETTIHNWIHGAVAASSILNLPVAEKMIISSLHSVQSSYFYKIHGLVQYWWTRWLHPKSHIKEILDSTKYVIKDVHDTKHHIKDLIDVKYVIKDVQDIGGIKRIKAKDKEKDLVENKAALETVDPFQNQGDPALIKTVIDQLGKLQMAAGVKRSPFIKPLMRPMVGESITKRGGARNKRP